MVNEVESILKEIRERVRTDHEQGKAAKDSFAYPNSESSNVGPPPAGKGDEGVDYAKQQAFSPNLCANLSAQNKSRNSESLSRLSAHLTTTARAWDRLPPLYSNRTGGMARLELWIKAQLKSMSRWFTWEQVNFNSAVHHALVDTLQALSAYAQELSRMRAELTNESESTDRETKALRAHIEARVTEIRKQYANLETRSRALDALASEMIETNARLSELAIRLSEVTTNTQLSELVTAMNAQLSEVANQLSEDDQSLREEQRVCFKQLSLEVSEAAALEERGRRAIESRLNKLEKASSKGKD